MGQLTTTGVVATTATLAAAASAASASALRAPTGIGGEGRFVWRLFLCRLCCRTVPPSSQCCAKI